MRYIGEIERKLLVVIRDETYRGVIVGTFLHPISPNMTKLQCILIIPIQGSHWQRLNHHIRSSNQWWTHREYAEHLNRVVKCYVSFMAKMIQLFPASKCHKSHFDNSRYLHATRDADYMILDRLLVQGTQETESYNTAVSTPWCLLAVHGKSRKRHYGGW